MSKQERINRRLEKKLSGYLDQYAKRVTANAKKKNGPDGSVSDIFIELNNQWVRDCTLAKRPLQREQFAVAVTNLNKLTEKVEKRIRFNYNLGRFLFWFIAFMIAVGIGVIIWSFYQLYIIHFQYTINF